MKTIQALILAGLAVLCLPGAMAAPGVVASGPVLAVGAMPAVSQWSLGMVIDGRGGARDGVQVLALSPGGTAERIGVQVGDRLLAINGQSLVGARLSNSVFESALADGSGEIQLEVERDGAPLTLSGRADAAAAVAGNGAATQPGCGYVSTVGVPPRVSRNIFRAEITQINGDSTPLEPLNRYQVPAGRHVVVVREFIDRHLISRGDAQRIHRVQRREGARAYKALVVDVEPGMRYSIGAELLPDRMSPDEIRAHDWWQPVVWESRPEACR